MGFCFCLVCSLSSEHRDTEAFESVAEDEQLPQVLDELHDLFLSPEAPIAKMSVRVKGQLFFFFMDANCFVSDSILSVFCLCMHCLFQVFPFLHLHMSYLLFNSGRSEHNDINVLHPFFCPSYF